jgi:PRA1 family protein
MTVGIASGVDAAGSSASETGSKPSVSINIESIRLTLTSLASRWGRRISFDTLRPLPVFLGVEPNFCISAGAFTPPIQKVTKAAPEKVQSRLRLNGAYFLSNYALLATTVAVVVALMHPGMVLFVGLLWALWTLHAFMIRHELVVFGIPVHSLLSVQQRFYVLFLLTSLVVVWKCLKPTIIFLAISLSMILTHAFLRDPKHIENSMAASSPSYDEDEEYGAINGGSGGADSGGSSNSSEVLVDRPGMTNKKRGGDVI